MKIRLPRGAAPRSRPHRSSSRKRPGFELFNVHDSEQRLGPNVVSATLDEVMAAIQRLPSDFGWEDVRDLVVPVLPRVRPYPKGSPDLVATMLPPGLIVGFSIDVGPALMTLSQELITSWNLSVADVSVQALRNLFMLAGRLRPRDVICSPIDGVPVQAVQTGLGIASTLVLAPTELRRLLGDQPKRLIAPMRDVLFAFPEDSDPALAALVFEEIAAEDPNHLQRRGFGFDGSAVSLRSMP